MMINNAARNDLVKAIGRRPPMRGTAVGFASKGMGMIMKMQTILRGPCFTNPRGVVLENVVISDVSAPRIQIVIDVIDAKPVVNPSLTCRIGKLSAKRFCHQFRQHGVDFVPCVVIGEQVRIHYSLYSRLKTIELNVASL